MKKQISITQHLSAGLRVCLLLTVLCFPLSSLSFAAPDILGPTGLIVMPNADVVDYHDYNVALGVSSWQGKGAINLSLNGSPLNNFEVGLSKFFSPDPTSLDLNLKYKLWNYSQNTPFSIALGGGVGFAQQSYVKGYITTTYPGVNKISSLLPSAAISLDNMGNTSNFHFLVGTEWVIFPNFRLLPEFDLTRVPSFNFGGRMALNKTTRVDFYALLNNNSSFGVQFSFNSNPKGLWFW